MTINIFQFFIAALLLMVVISNSLAQPSNESHPNIVLFIADDLGSNDMGCYGNPVVRTPNIDRLADQSLLFTQAFAASPTCSPSRASILTGLLPFRNVMPITQALRKELKHCHTI